MTRSTSLVALAATLALSPAAMADSPIRIGGINLPGNVSIGGRNVDLSRIGRNAFKPRVSLPPVVNPPAIGAPIVRPPVTRPIVTPPPRVCPTPTPAPIPVPAPVPAPTVVNPIGYVQPARPYYFGMSLVRAGTVYGTGLRVVSLTHGAPAHLAGLEIGDILLASNGVGFSTAYSNEHGVSLLQSSVGAGAPAPAVTTAAVGYVAPPAPVAMAQLTVLDVRSNRPTYVTVAPRNLSAPTLPSPGLPAPAAAAASPTF